MTLQPASKRPTRGVIALIVAIVSDVMLWVSFSNGISAALDGSGSGAGAWPIVFLVFFGLLLVAGAAAILHLLKRESLVINIITVALFAVPVVLIVKAWIGA